MKVKLQLEKYYFVIFSLVRENAKLFVPCCGFLIFLTDQNIILKR